MKKNKLGKKLKYKRVPYSKATDDEKVSRNWNKAVGLYKRGEYSVAIVRCGTCIELAINLGVRQELVVERDLPLQFVDRLLKSANGLTNKYQNIYLPIMAEYQEHDFLKQLWKNHIFKINSQRNRIVHSGEFRKKRVAQEVMEHTHEALQYLMDLYDHHADLKPF